MRNRSQEIPAIYHTYYVETGNRSEQRIYRNRVRRQREMRRHITMLILSLCFIIICAVSVSSIQSCAQDDSAHISCKYYTSIAVGVDDTLWSIAERYMDEEHFDTIDDYITEVKEINSLADDQISYGEYLVIPYYSALGNV